MAPKLLILLAILVACPLAALAQGDGDPGSQDRGTILHDGLERDYVLTVPSSLPPGELVPLVIVLHGGGGSARVAMQQTGFDVKAEEEGFIAAFPEGTGVPPPLYTWNADHCCGLAMRRGVDDIGFIAALIDTLVERYPVDPDRVYVTGMSNGAVLTNRLAIALADRIAAIGVVAGALFGDEALPQMPVSAVIFHGTEDRPIPVEGGRAGGLLPFSFDGTPVMAADYQARFWAAADGCDLAQPAIDGTADYVHETYACPGGLGVEFYLVVGQGHAWPGGNPGWVFGADPSTALSATDLTWAFFERHSRADRIVPETLASE